MFGKTALRGGSNIMPEEPKTEVEAQQPMPSTMTKTVTTTLDDKPAQDSTIWGVSVRAWLVIMLVFTLCLSTLLNPLFGYLITGDLFIEIKEPFYSAVTISLGYFFGQSVKK